MKSIQVNFIYGSERDIRFFRRRFNLEPQINKLFISIAVRSKSITIINVGQYSYGHRKHVKMNCIVLTGIRHIHNFSSARQPLHCSQTNMFKIS